MKKTKKVYGIVEGFFSEPLPTWTETERLKTVNFVAKNAKNIRTYLYCPKDDPYVTKKYDNLYPNEEIKKIQKFINNCENKNIEFAFGLNPTFEGETNYGDVEIKILSKIEQIIGIGCKNVMLLFDDIPLAYDVVDGNVNSKVRFEKVIEMVNAIYSKLDQKIDNFWFCGPDYCFQKESPVTLAMRNLNNKIDIAWSGNNVFTKSIRREDLKRVKKLLGIEKKILYWSNYPVNDCEQAVGTFNLGGFYPIEKAVMNELSGVLVNPMREAMANLPFYVTFSKWIENDKYERVNCYLEAMKNTLGIDKKMSETMISFSSRNVVDSNFVGWMFPKSKIYATKKDGKKYLVTVKSLVKEIEGWKQILKTVANDEVIQNQDFEKVDWFPTKTYVPRYFTEIVKILNQRKKLYSLDRPEEVKEKYRGSKRLAISKKDSVKYLAKINRLIVGEKKRFVIFLNDKSISNEEKRAVLIRRRWVNRFTINELE